MKAHGDRVHPIQSLNDVQCKKRDGKYWCGLCVYSAKQKSHMTRHLKKKHLVPQVDVEHHNNLWCYALEKEKARLAANEAIEIPSTSSARQVQIIENVLIRAAQSSQDVQSVQRMPYEERPYHEEDVVEMMDSDDEPLAKRKTT